MKERNGHRAPPPGPPLRAKVARLSGEALLERMALRGSQRRIIARPAGPEEINSLHAMLTARLDHPVASPEAAQQVQDASPGSIWALRSESHLLGGVAFLPLNTLGVYELLYGKLDRTNPRLPTIAPGRERPTALYVWAVVARGDGLLGLPDLLRQLDTQRFGDVDIWADPVTAEGEALARRLGFALVDSGSRNFFKLAREGR